MIFWSGYSLLILYILIENVLYQSTLGGEIIEVHGGILGGKGGGDLTHSQPEVLLYSHSGGSYRLPTMNFDRPCGSRKT